MEEGAGVELELGAEGIARLVLGDGAGAPRIGAETLRRMEELLPELESQIGAGHVRALIVCGGAPGTFAEGAELRELRTLADSAEAARRSLAGQRALRRLEELPVPSVAAIAGPCLDAGIELALACSYRLASDSPDTRLGLPQMRLGLPPALGATVRLPRLVGVQASLALILYGRTLRASEAEEIGLVDAVRPEAGLLAAAERFALERVERGRVRTGARRRMPRRLLEDTAPGRRLVFRRAARDLRRTPAPAPTAAARVLRLVADGVTLPLDRAFELEAEAAGGLRVGDEAQALLHAAASLRDSVPRCPAPAAPAPERAGVLGAGSVGSEVAALLASAGMPVLLKDRRRDALLRGGRHALALLDRDARARGLPADLARARSALVTGASGFGGFGTVDLVIAATGGEGDATEEALREAEEHTRVDCVLAVASLTLSPTRVQEGLDHPERVVGLRFSRPTDLFPLMEVVVGEATGTPAVEACVGLARRLGRVPVVVPDRPDSPGNRLLGAYLGESLRLLEEGVGVEEVDRVAEEVGFALGPFRRMDAMGVERCAALLRRLAEACGDRMAAPAGVDRLLGSPPLFYRYDKGLPTGLNPGLAEPARPDPSRAERIRARLEMSLVNEAARVVEEMPPLDAGVVDAVALAGVGYPRARGGPLHRIERDGAEAVAEALGTLAEAFGERFAPAPLLRERAGGDSATGHHRGGVLR